MALYIQIAEKLEKKFPKADLIGISDNDLINLVTSVGEKYESSTDWLYKLKMAWTTVRSQGDNNSELDAFI